jgi:hypothetical protein
VALAIQAVDYALQNMLPLARTLERDTTHKQLELISLTFAYRYKQSVTSSEQRYRALCSSELHPYIALSMT